MNAKAKKGLIVFGSIVIILICTITIFLIVELNCIGFGIKVKDNLNYAYDNVLTKINKISEANPYLRELSVLGSHDAATYNMKKGAPLSYETNETLVKFYPVIKGFQYRFGVTQTQNIFNQMMQGSRFIQIKCTNYNGNWYASHSALCETLDTYILEVLKFLNHCDKNGYREVVYLILNPMYLEDGINMVDFFNYVYGVKYENKTLLDYIFYPELNGLDSSKSPIDIRELRYNDVTNNGAQTGLVMFYPGYFYMDPDKEPIELNDVKNYAYFLDHRKINIDWYNRSDPDLLIRDMCKRLEIIKNGGLASGSWSVNQYSTSFTFRSTQDALSTIFNWSLIKLAKELNSYLVEDETRLKEWIKLKPIIQVDYVTSNYNDFNNRINKVMMKYNQEVVNKYLDVAV